ncbi:hypothetical protein QA584_21410 [Anaerocolumna sp. AGMB13025]|uniref:DUF6709 family protein n=1 Tax=Anaerocolumna sp. AGMB13025 TaxID=3039116 RepID=UPI00241C3CC6|nr:DUF6709 family protein [Anaerocolumna sp. AGMB13025]WFR56151.1 hypothetical protein QA584_21410 [Anaerocolumna sp. AGMB13025]
MFNELKRLSMKKVTGFITLGIAAIIILSAIFGSDALKLFKGPADLDSLSADELNNTYTKGEIKALYDSFGEYYSKNDDGSDDVQSRYYVVPFGDKYYALKVSKRDFGIADKINNETYEYLLGDRETLTTTMAVQGTFTEMDADASDYYYEWFESAGLMEGYTPEDFKEVALPYVLTVDQIGQLDETTLYVILGLIGLVLISVLFLLIKGLSGGYLSSIKKYVKANEGTLSLERLDHDFANAVQVEHVRIGESFLYFFTGFYAKILNHNDIIWAYLEEITHKTNGIKTGVTKSLIIYTRKKRKFTISMKSAAYVNDVLKVLAQNQPHIVIGYSDDLKKCFNKDFETFVKIPYMHEAAASSEDNTEA